MGFALAADFARREAVDEAFLLAKMRAAVAGVVLRKHALRRHGQPGDAVPRAPLAGVVYEGAGRPAIGVVAATGLGIERRMPVLVDVVHLGMAVAVLAGV